VFGDSRVSLGSKLELSPYTHPNQEIKMTTITIDDKAYEVDSLSDDSKAQLASLQYVDSELRRLQAQAAALQTARIAYGRALKQTLEEGKAPEEDEVSIQGLGDSIKFDE